MPHTRASNQWSVTIIPMTVPVWLRIIHGADQSGSVYPSPALNKKSRPKGIDRTPPELAGASHFETRSALQYNALRCVRNQPHPRAGGQLGRAFVRCCVHGATTRAHAPRPLSRTQAARRARAQGGAPGGRARAPTIARSRAQRLRIGPTGARPDRSDRRPASSLRIGCRGAISEAPPPPAAAAWPGDSSRISAPISAPMILRGTLANLRTNLRTPSGA